MKKRYLNFLILSALIVGCDKSSSSLSPSNSNLSSTQESSSVIDLSYTLKGSVDSIAEGIIKYYTVTLNGKEINIDNGNYEVKDLKESDVIVISKEGYYSKTFSGKELLANTESKEILNTTRLIKMPVNVGNAFETKTWSLFGNFSLDTTRDESGIKAIFKTSNSEWLNNSTSSQIELYISTGLDTSYRNASTYKIIYTNKGKLTASNYGNKKFDSSLFNVTNDTKDSIYYIEITIPYAILNINETDIIGLSFGEWNELEKDWCPMASIIDGKEKNVASPSSYVRVDKANETFINQYNCYKEDNPFTDEDIANLIANYPINFATSSSSVDGDNIYCKASKVNETFVFDMIGFGVFEDNEYIKMVIHNSSNNKANWELDSNDIQIVFNKTEARYLTNSTYFFEKENFKDYTNSFGTTPAFTQVNSYYWTIQFAVPFSSIPEYDLSNKYGVLLVEFGDEIYNDNPESSMFYLGDSRGDIASQSSYITIQERTITNHQPFENYPIEFATSADDIYCDISINYDEEYIELSFAGYNELSDDSFIRFILKENKNLTKTIWALDPNDVSFVIYKDAAYLQSGVNSFWSNEKGKELPFINDTKANCKTIYDPSYTYNDVDGYFLMTFKIDFSETLIASIDENTEFRGILIEFNPSIVGGDVYKQNGSKIGTGDPALQENYLSF